MEIKKTITSIFKVPILKINKDDLKKLNFDLNIYKQGIDDDVVEFFKKQFEYEFK